MNLLRQNISPIVKTLLEIGGQPESREAEQTESELIYTNEVVRDFTVHLENAADAETRSLIRIIGANAGGAPIA